MSLIKKLGVFVTLGLGIVSYANAQSDNDKSDTTIVNKEYFVKETKINEDKTILDEKEYIIEEAVFYNSEGKITSETKNKYSVEEKNLSTKDRPKNIRKSIQIDTFLESTEIKKHKYDSLGRKLEISIKENNDPAKSNVKEKKILYTYEGENIEILYDNDNNGKPSKGDKREFYISKLGQWISEKIK